MFVQVPYQNSSHPSAAAAAAQGAGHLAGQIPAVVPGGMSGGGAAAQPLLQRPSSGPQPLFSSPSQQGLGGRNAAAQQQRGSHIHPQRQGQVSRADP